MPPMAPLTRTLLLINIAVFVGQLLLPGVLEQWFALWPTGTGLFNPWQLVTYAFLHGGIAHILFNMFGLVSFGSELEYHWGSRRFAAFYFASVLAAAFTQLLVTNALGQGLPTVGASGGIYGLLLGFALMFPKRRVTLIFPPIPMPAWLFVLLFGCLELYLGVSGTRSGIAHFAHLGGMIGGFLTLLYWRTPRSR